MLSIWTSLKFCSLVKSLNTVKADQTVFYAPLSKDRGHIVLLLSVCPSVRLSVRLSVQT